MTLIVFIEIFFLTLLVFKLSKFAVFSLPTIVNPLVYLLFSFYLAFYIHLFLPINLDYNEFSNSHLYFFIQLTLLSIIGVVVGFYFFGKKIKFSIRHSKIIKIEKKSIKPIIIIYIIGILSMWYNVVLGTGGYQIYSEDVSLEQNLIIKIFIQLKDISSFILISFYFLHKESKYKKLIILLIFSDLLISIFTGFKGAIFSIVITILIFRYIKYGKIHLGSIFISLIMLIFTLFFIESYRLVKKIDNSAKISDVFSLLNYSIKEKSVDYNFAFKYIERNNLLNSSTLGVAYYPKLSADSESPNFLKKIFISPLLAFVPRTLWKSKPINIDGLWYNNNVIGSPHVSFTPLGKIIYLYYSGGIFCVFLGFMFIGFFLRYIISYANTNNYFYISKYVYFLFLLLNLEMSYDYFLINVFYSLILFNLFHIIIKIYPNYYYK